MIAWLWNLIFGNFCEHEWETQKECDLVDHSGVIGKVIYLKCTKCGDWKRKNLSSWI